MIGIRLPHRAAGFLPLAALASLLLLFLSSTLVVDPDLYHEMALIRAALSEGTIPREEIFAYTPAVSPSVHHEWGTGAILYWVATRGGGAGLLALKYALGFAVLAATLLAARLARASWGTLCALAPVAIVMADVGFTTVRAGFFTLLLLSTILVAIQMDRAGARWWVLPWLPLHLLWLNLHGGFVAGLLLLALHWAEGLCRGRGAQRHLIACGAAMAALVAVNPYGLHYVGYLARALAMPRPRILEWQPIWAAPHLLAMVAVSLVVAIVAVRELGLRRAPGWPAVLISALAATCHLRHVSLYALVWLALVPGWVDQTATGAWLQDGWARRRRLVAGLSTALIVACLTGAWSREPWRLRIPANRAEVGHGPPVIYPAGAVEYLRARQFEGNVLTSYDTGSFVIWNLHPAVRVGMDSRYEVAYLPEVADRISEFYAGGPGWRSLLGQYPTDLVLAATTDPVAELLERQTAWRIAYADDVFRLYARPGLELPIVDRRGERIEARFP